MYICIYNRQFESHVYPVYANYFVPSSVPKSLNVQIFRIRSWSSHRIFLLSSIPLTDRHRYKIDLYKSKKKNDHGYKYWESETRDMIAETLRRRRNPISQTTVHSTYSANNQRSISNIISRRNMFPFRKKREKKLLSKASSEPSDYDKHFPLVSSYDSYWKLVSESLRDDLSCTLFHSIY